MWGTGWMCWRDWGRYDNTRGVNREDGTKRERKEDKEDDDV